EHHSNIVPWQMLCQEKGCKLVVVPIDDSGEMIESEFDRLLTDKTKFVSVGHVSNALGSINPVKEIVRKSHERGVPVMIDGAQATPHMPVDVQDIGCDFYAFSGHKVYGPTGIGILYGKAEHLEAMPPYQGGGDMISSVSFNGTTYNEIPYKFEAGTPNIAGAIGLGAALDYLSSLGLDRIAAHEKEVLDYGTKRLIEIPGLRLIGTARNKAGVLSFVMEDIHPNDIGTLLDQKGIAVRTGQHCAEPVMDRFGIHSTVRASLGLYNSKEDIDSLVDGLESVRRIFA
ncbi:MAG: cysteine desulfurase, partial [Candidatus Omnitrophica bacterium]|nr:cysteine desulfurase [Candidatus Omnitrophota bacterium]